MCLEAISLRECVVTNYALKCITNCMNPIMYNQINFLREELSTVITENILTTHNIQFCYYDIDK